MKNPTIDLRTVSRHSFDVDLPFTVTKAGTENCCAHFRLTPQQEQIVRAHFKIRADKPIQFATCEISSQGYGWYLAFSLSDRPDQALRAILNIKAALWHAQHPNAVAKAQAEQRAREVAQQVVAATNPKRLVIIKKKITHFGKVVLRPVDRTLQAISNPNRCSIDDYRVDKIKAITCASDLGVAVAHLRDHFAPVRHTARV